MRGAVLCVIVAAGFSPVAADTPKADPRAVAECNARGGGFTAINDCLPGVHVGLAVIDAFHNAYGPDGDFLKNRCLELNELKSDAAATCIRKAVEDAVQLKDRLPPGATIDDPHFPIIADAAKLALLNAAEAEARKAFPDQTMWGGGRYMPYRE